MKQSISLFLLISMLSLQSQSSQSSLKVIKMVKGQKNLGAQSYVQIKETRGRQAIDQKLSIFGWIKLSQFEKNINPLLKLSFANQSLQSHKDLENFVLLNYNHELKKLQLTYFEDRHKREQKSFKFFMSADEWVFLSLGLNFQDKKIQLYASQQNKSFEAVVWKILNMNISMTIPQEFNLSIGCFPAQSDIPKSVTTRCTKGAFKDFSYINNYLKNPSMNFMLDDDYLMVNNFVFDGESKKNQIIFPKNQKANALVLIGKKKYEKLGSTQIQVFSGLNQLTAKGLFLSNQRLTTSSTFTVYMKMSFRNPTLTMNLMKLKLSNGQELLVQIKRGNKKKYYLDFSIKNRGFQFSTGDFMKSNQVANFQLTFVREGQLFWVMFIEPHQKMASQKIPLGDFSSTEFQILDTNFNNQNTTFKFFRLSTNNQSSGPAINFSDTYDKKSKCQWEIGTSKNEDRCLSCKHNFVMLPQQSTCSKFCPYGFQNILGVCYDCKGDQCKKLTKKFFDIKKISDTKFNVTLTNPIYMRGIKIKDLFYVKVENEKFSDDYAFNKTLISKNPYVVQFDFIFRDMKKNHLVTFTLRNEKIYSISRNAIPRQIVSFYTGYDNAYPLKEDFIYANNHQTNPNKLSFLKRPYKRSQNKSYLKQRSIDEQLNDQIRQTNEYLLQQKLEKMFQNPGIIPMPLPKMDKNGYVGKKDNNGYQRNDNQNFMQLKPRINSNKNRSYKPIMIQQQQPFDRNNFKQTQTELPFVNRYSYQQNNKFYESNQYLPKIDGRQNPVEYKFQQDRQYFYPLNSQIKQQNKRKVIYYPQQQNQQVFYPKENPLNDVLMRKIKQDKQKRQNQLFFYPVEDRLADDKQFLKNFPLLDQRKDIQTQSNQRFQNKGLTMLKEHDQKKYNMEKLKKQFKDYDYQKNNSYQQQPDIVEQYRRNQVLNNVFSTYQDQQKLDDVFETYNNQQQKNQVVLNKNEQQQLDLVFQNYNGKKQLENLFQNYNDKKQLENLFQNYNDKKQLDSLFQTYNNKKQLDNFFKKYNDQKKENETLKKENETLKKENLSGQLEFLQKIFNVFNLEQDQRELKQQQNYQPTFVKEKNLKKDELQILKDQQNALVGQPDIETDQNLILKKQSLQHSLDINDQNIKTAKKLQIDQNNDNDKEEQLDYDIEYIFAIILYCAFFIALLFGFFKFILNVYNKQKFSTISLLKLAQILLFMQLFSFWDIIINNNPHSLTNFLHHIRKLFLNDQVIWKVDQMDNIVAENNVNSDKKGYNLLNGIDLFQNSNLSNLFFQNYSLMILLVVVFAIIYMVLNFISKRQQKQAMDNYIQEGHYKLQNGHYKLALALTQISQRIFPLLFLAFGLEIAVFGVYNLFYVRKWTGYHLLSYIFAILFLILFVFYLFKNNCQKKTKSKKLKKKCKNLNQGQQVYDQGIKKLKIIGFTFFLMGTLTVFLQNHIEYLLFCQFVLVVSLLLSAQNKDQRKYFTTEQIITFITLSLICLFQYLTLIISSFKEFEFLIILLIVFLIIESAIVIVYDFFVNENRVMTEMEIFDSEEKQEDLEAISLNTDNKKIRTKDIDMNEFQKMSNQIY